MQRHRPARHPLELHPISFLRRLLDDDDAAIITATARLAVVLGDSDDRITTVRRLLAVLPTADWFLREEIQGCLLNLYPEAGPAVEQEYAKRNGLPEVERVMDSTLRLIEGVRRKAAQSRSKAPET